MDIIFGLDDGNLHFGGEVGYKVINSESILDVIVLQVDGYVLEAIAAASSDELANLIHPCLSDILSEKIVSISRKVINNEAYLEEVFSNTVVNVLGFHEF